MCMNIHSSVFVPLTKVQYSYLNYLFAEAFIIDEAPVGFPLPQTPSLPLSRAGSGW